MPWRNHLKSVIAAAAVLSIVGGGDIWLHGRHGAAATPQSASRHAPATAATTVAAAPDTSNLADVSLEAVPMTAAETRAMLNAWDGGMAWWWQKGHALPWNERCNGESRAAVNQAWYPLACFMIPVWRDQTHGMLSVGESPVFSLSHAHLSEGVVTSDIVVISCKDNRCAPALLRRLSMAESSWHTLARLMVLVRDGAGSLASPAQGG